MNFLDSICKDGRGKVTLEQAIGLTHSKIGLVGFLNEDESVYTLHAVSVA
jgi:hypothetical protein